eukprot:727925-Rhodomonas_salina.2
MRFLVFDFGGCILLPRTTNPWLAVATCALAKRRSLLSALPRLARVRVLFLQFHTALSLACHFTSASVPQRIRLRFRARLLTLAS